jgi:hypothetical protein
MKMPLFITAIVAFLSLTHWRLMSGESIPINCNQGSPIIRSSTKSTRSCSTSSIHPSLLIKDIDPNSKIRFMLAIGSKRTDLKLVKAKNVLHNQIVLLAMS